MVTQSECSERLVSSVIAYGEEVLLAVTGMLRSDDRSDKAKLKSAAILGRHSFLFDGALCDEPRRSSTALLQELDQLLKDAVA